MKMSKKDIFYIRMFRSEPRNHSIFDKQLKLKPDCIIAYNRVFEAYSGWKQQTCAKQTLLNIINLTN